MKLSWRDDPELEKRLRDLLLSWQRRTFRLDELDVATSRQNNARTGPYDPELSLEYSLGLSDGDAFPAICVRKCDPGFKLFPILSGNHRVGGVELLVDQGDIPVTEALIEAYVIDNSDPMLCELIERAANRWVGRGTDREKALIDAEWMMGRYSMPLADVCRHFRLKEDWVRVELKRRDKRARFEGSSIDADLLKNGHLDKLSQLPTERLGYRAAQIIIGHKLTVGRASEMIDDVKASAKLSEEKAIRVLKDWEERLKQDQPIMQPVAAAATKAPRRKYRSRFLTHFVGFHNFLLRSNQGHPFVTLDELQITDVGECHEVRTRWREVKRTMDGIFREHDQQRAERKRSNGTVQSKSRRKKASK